jgi:uncharacterized protein (TIGR02231 family)
MKRVTLPIAEVTVLEDRAHVVRRGRISLESGQVRICIEGVAPVLADKTLLARIEGESARVVDARVQRRKVVQLAEDGGDLIEELRRERERLDDRITATQAELAAGEARRETLEALAQLTLGEIADDVAWGRPARDAGEIRDVSERRRDLARQRIELAHRLEREHRELARLEGRIAALETPADDAVADLEIDVTAERRSEAELTVDYVVPNACWRPYHRAELSEDGLRFETDACVWQRTGEAWDDVSLVLSTERASLGTEPPELASDVLRVQRKREALVVETREQRIDTAGVAGTSETMELMGIDDAGEPQKLTPRRRTSVPSDGRPHRIVLSAFEAPVERSLESVPELSHHVVLRTVQQNNGEGPILAGPVDLVRGGGLSGRTSVLFVGPGERFELGWGPEAELRVSRRVELEKEDTNLIGNWIAHKHHVEVRLSNLGERQHTVHVRERVPVSEIEKVKVEPHAKDTSEKKTPDKDGFVDWDVTLEPLGSAALDLCYTLRKHSDVVGL